jgi:hypothetical protein
MIYRTRVQGLVLVIVMLITPAVWAEPHSQLFNGATCTDPYSSSPSFPNAYTILGIESGVVNCHLTMTDIWTPLNLSYVWVGGEVFSDTGDIMLRLCFHNAGHVQECGEPAYLRRVDFGGVIVSPPQIPPHTYMFGAHIHVFFPSKGTSWGSGRIFSYQATWIR